MASFFVDIDTQFDFLSPQGALYVPDSASLVPIYEKLYTAIKAGKAPVIGSVDAHAPDDPEFEVFPPHCVKGEPGQLKVDETIMRGITFVENADGGLEKVLGADWRGKPISDLPPQVIFEKQTYSFFGNQNLEAFLEKLEGEGLNGAIVFGVATDFCVNAAVIGLLERGFRTYVVTDAIKPVYPEKEAEILESWREKGAEFVTSLDAIKTVVS